MDPADVARGIQVKFSEHVVAIRKMVPARRAVAGGSGWRKRVVRVYFDDVDATDSSSSEESGGVRRRVKRHVHEIGIEVAAAPRRMALAEPKKEEAVMGGGERVKRRLRGVR
ncbi:hypothetical protein GW17_00039073, partial [Ensete ventricosum]